MIFGRDTHATLGVGQPLFFTNPASVARKDITLKMSTDGTASWSTVHLVHSKNRKRGFFY